MFKFDQETRLAAFAKAVTAVQDWAHQPTEHEPCVVLALNGDRYGVKVSDVFKCVLGSDDIAPDFFKGEPGEPQTCAVVAPYFLAKVERLKHEAVKGCLELATSEDCDARSTSEDRAAFADACEAVFYRQEGEPEPMVWRFDQTGQQARLIPASEACRPLLNCKEEVPPRLWTYCDTTYGICAAVVLGFIQDAE